jgi:hypothetical protein
MDADEARKAIESLKYGNPPQGEYLTHLTVGLSKQQSDLEDILTRNRATTQFITGFHSLPGFGKTHFLRLIQAIALKRNFAVSFVKLDCAAEVRLNRMDQIFGAVCNSIKIPDGPIREGIGAVLSYIEPNWKDVLRESSQGTDDIFHTMQYAIRAWMTGRSEVREIVEQWMMRPWDFDTRPGALYEVVYRRPRYGYENDFNLRKEDYLPSWRALAYLHRLVRAAGFQGLVILFDDFDNFVGLKTWKHKTVAMQNACHFITGTRFPGITFFTMGPAYSKWRREVKRRREEKEESQQVRQRDYRQVSDKHGISGLFLGGEEAQENGNVFRLPYFTTENIRDLTHRVYDIYRIVYTDNVCSPGEIDDVAEKICNLCKNKEDTIPRKAVQHIVSALDSFYRGV